MKVNRLENVFCNPPLPDGDYVLLSEVQDDIDELVDMLDWYVERGKKPCTAYPFNLNGGGFKEKQEEGEALIAKHKWE